MSVKAQAKDVRISPIRLRLTADLIRGKNTDEALSILNNLNNKASRIIKKVLDSAIANAVNNNEMDSSKLYVDEIRVDQGQVYKRGFSDSRGRSGRRDRRCSHVTIMVAEIN